MQKKEEDFVVVVIRHRIATKKQESKKKTSWLVGESSKTKNGKAIESRRKKKKQERVFSIIGKYRLLFVRKFIFCCKYFNFLYVGCLNFKFTFIRQLRGSYHRRPSRSLSLSVYISPQQRRLSSLHRYIFPPFWVLLLFLLRYLPTKFTF